MSRLEDELRIYIKYSSPVHPFTYIAFHYFPHIAPFLPNSYLRCTPHEESSCDLHYTESAATPGSVSRDGGRGSGALLQTDITHTQYL